MRRARAAAGILVLSLAGCAGAGISVDDLLGAAGLESAALDERTVVAGLQEALRVGTERTVARTSRENGYYGDSRIRIPLPDELRDVGAALRSVGLGHTVDELEVAMNRAAERAAAEAAPVFLDALGSMTFRDAHAILRGGERAATDYFEARTRRELFARFRPIVDASVREVGLVRLYDSFVAQVARLPLVPRPELDVPDYVTERGLRGLFTVLAGEEARIRRDPAARTTQLLRRVFASEG